MPSEIRSAANSVALVVVGPCSAVANAPELQVGAAEHDTVVSASHEMTGIKRMVRKFLIGHFNVDGPTPPHHVGVDDVGPRRKLA